MRTLHLASLTLTLLACAPDAVPAEQPVAAPAVEVVPVLALDPPEEEEPVAEPVSPVVVDTTAYTLRRGETLAHFARWAELPVEVVAESSGLPLDGVYPVGTVVR